MTSIIGSNEKGCGDMATWRYLALKDKRRLSRSVPPLAQPIEASFAKLDLNAPTSVSISASVIGVENVHVPVLMMLQPSS